MAFIKAYVLWFDGYNGVAVDYLDNQIDFNVSQVPPCIVPYLAPNVAVIVEETEDGLFVTTPESSVLGWLDDKEDQKIYELDEVDADKFIINE